MTQTSTGSESRRPSKDDFEFEYTDSGILTKNKADGSMMLTSYAEAGRLMAEEFLRKLKEDEQKTKFDISGA